jgi:hypothetical protein
VTRLRFAAVLAIAALGGGCGDREVPDAEWSFQWSVAGRPVVDVWTDNGVTCEKSDRDDGNILSLLHKSKLAACKKDCKPKPRGEQLACRLTCDKQIKLAARECTQKTRKVPPPSLFPVR